MLFTKQFGKLLLFAAIIIGLVLKYTKSPLAHSYICYSLLALMMFSLIEALYNLSSIIRKKYVIGRVLSYEFISKKEAVQEQGYNVTIDVKLNEFTEDGLDKVSLQTTYFRKPKIGSEIKIIYDTASEKWVPVNRWMIAVLLVIIIIVSVSLVPIISELHLF